MTGTTRVEWLYFSDRDQALIRIPVTDGVEGRGERYWGRSGGWMATDRYCDDWADQIRDTVSYQYRLVDETEVPAICQRIDAQQGGVFRDRWRFWDDQADSWAVNDAFRRAAELEGNLANAQDLDLSGYEIQEDEDELSRLRVFIDRVS